MKTKRKRRKTEQKKFIQYTKRLVTVITILGCLWVSWSYILGTYALVRFGSVELLENLSTNVVTSIICVSLGYFLKAFFETFCEKKMQNQEEKNAETTQQTIEKYDGV